MCDIGSRLVIISGPSGAGKDTIANRLIEIDPRFSLSVSATTRPPRKGEIDGVSYHFLSEDEFLKMADEGEFVEYARYSSRYYGTLKSDVRKRVEDGKIILLVIDVQGAENVKKMYKNVLSVFIMPPSREVLEKRLKDRMTECHGDICKRIDIAKEEIKKKDSYDYIVINDDLEKAVGEVYNIINAKLEF